MHINELLQQISKRAERNDPEILRQSFVAVGAVTAALNGPDHQIIFGRRGTGKTHALLYKKQTVTDERNIGVFIDLRILGSDGSIYNDANLSISQRATRLLIDFYQAIHEGLLSEIQSSNHADNLSSIAPSLNEFLENVYELEVRGETETEQEVEAQKGKSSESGLTISQAQLQATAKSGSSSSSASKNRTKKAGKEEYRVHFATIRNGLQSISKELGAPIWILVDEWSAIPAELQPYLADMIRKTIYPLKNYTVIIAAIQHRAHFSINLGSDYIGIELGADASSSINLDEFMVSENDPEKAKTFFSELLFRHYKSLPQADEDVEKFTTKKFMRTIFSSTEAQDEFIKAAEGVPRDAINILSRCAQKAGLRKMNLSNVRAAARAWFQQDKSAFLDYNQEADYFLRWIIDKVIGERKARAFLVRKDQRSSVIDLLFDNRLLHLLRSSVSAHDEPGVRYTAYKLDYGCYVELMTTKNKPKGLLPSDAEGENFVEVPADDYRAIRRAILDIDEFDYDKLKNSLASSKVKLGAIGDALEFDIRISEIMNALITRPKKRNQNIQPSLFSDDDDDLFS